MKRAGKKVLPGILLGALCQLLSGGKAADGDHCRDMNFVHHIVGKALKRHLIRSISTPNCELCQIECFMERKCVSYNCRGIPCELSSADHIEHPGDLVDEKGSDYHAAENACINNTCPQTAYCLNGFTPKGYMCECKPGFTGSSCEDVDECKEDKQGCSADTTCQNTVGSFKCRCNDGYQGDRKTCNDVDECDGAKHDCSSNAKCRNTVGSFECKCSDGYQGDGKTCIALAKNCAELYESGGRTNGIFKINPDEKQAFDVFCDQTTNGGGWTVFQKRIDGSVDFYRNWTEYKQGFGNLSGEFWLGLEKIHRLTSQTNNKLRVELEDFEGKTAHAEYDTFTVASEAHKYKLSVEGYSGTAGNSLHEGKSFTTKDEDNDEWDGNCGVKRRGAWWYKRCGSSNLNGFYYNGWHNSSYGDGVNWYTWKRTVYYSVKRAELKIRPADFP